jgi:hypothetical protein
VQRDELLITPGRFSSHGESRQPAIKVSTDCDAFVSVYEAATLHLAERASQLLSDIGTRWTIEPFPLTAALFPSQVERAGPSTILPLEDRALVASTSLAHFNLFSDLVGLVERGRMCVKFALPGFSLNRWIAARFAALLPQLLQ